MSLKLIKKYTTKLDSKKRMTIKNPEFEYYQVNIFDDGNILLEPKVLVDAFEDSGKTLNMMDNSIKNFRRGKVSKPVNFKKYLSAKEKD
jgi:hypoxanthine phosphoribosyltransferase